MRNEGYEADETLTFSMICLHRTFLIQFSLQKKVICCSFSLDLHLEKFFGKRLFVVRALIFIKSPRLGLDKNSRGRVDPKKNYWRGATKIKKKFLRAHM